MATDIGRHLKAGEAPFVNQYLFGGNYQMLRDVSNLIFWNPILLLSSWLLGERAFLWLADLSASIHLLVSACVFTLLLNRLRELRGLVLSDNRVVFLSLSFTFCAYSLVVGPSWLMYLANQASLPILMLGVFHARKIPGLLLVALGFVYAFLAGHPGPLIFTIFFFTLFLVAFSFVDKSWERLGRWSGGLLLALIIASPFLVPALQGFNDSTRNAPFSVGQASQYSIPMLVLVVSFFASDFGVALCQALGIHRIEGLGAFAGCAASGLALQGFKRSRRHENRQSENGSSPAPQAAISPFDACLAGMMMLVVLFVMRPLWLAQILTHLPLFRSLRWPFREVLFLVFFAHLWMAVRPVVARRRTILATSLGGATVFLLSFFLVSPPSFNAMPTDRNLLISGQAFDYWKRIKQTLGPNDQIIAVVEPSMARQYLKEIPYSLIGAYNYPSLFEVRSLSGYTAAGLAASYGGRDAPYHWGGIFSPEVGARLLAQNPNLKALQLVSMKPLRIEIRDAKSRREVELPPLVTNAENPIRLQSARLKTVAPAF